jgi:hypothetical protein
MEPVVWWCNRQVIMNGNWLPGKEGYHILRILQPGRIPLVEKDRGR